MFVKVGAPEVGNAKGSSAKLANYLNKDNNTQFFDRDNNLVCKERVQAGIDGNTAGLGRNDDKFYTVYINPSQAELKHLIGRSVDDFDKLTPKEKEALYKDLQEYTHKVMDIYAQNFQREDIKSGNDLLYFARIETSREYRHSDKEVKAGIKKVGEKKDGLNLHVHVVVSRKSKDGKAKLSPNGRFRGSAWERDGKTVRRGFSHDEFKKECWVQFSQRFNYQSKSQDNYQAHQNNTSGRADKGAGKAVANIAKGQAKGQVTGRVQGAVQKAFTGGHMRTEIKAMNQTQRIVKAVANPKGALKAEVIRAAKKAIKFATQTKQMTK